VRRAALGEGPGVGRSEQLGVADLDGEGDAAGQRARGSARRKAESRAAKRAGSRVSARGRGGNWKRSTPSFSPSPSAAGATTASAAKAGSRKRGFGRGASRPGPSRTEGKVQSWEAFTRKRKPGGTWAAWAAKAAAGSGA
jgi:hypothetical protein